MAQVRARPDVNDVGLRLARAHLATRSGRFDRARAELEAGLRHRPDDPVVWRAWLDRAVAAGESAAAREALGHLPADALDPARVQWLRAWLAANRDDVQAERHALEGQVALDPSDPAALTRLAELDHQAGDAAAAARYRRRKAEVDADRARYFRLYKRGLSSDRAIELARLAERLGRRFEARGFWDLVRRQDPSNPEAAAALPRLAPARRPAGELAPSLASLIASEPESPATHSNSEVADSPGAMPRFVNRARDSGLDSFVFDNGASPIHQLPEMASGGIGLLDFDRDGWLDVYAVQGGTFPPRAGRASSAPGDCLFRNRGDGTFEDVTESAGIGSLPRGYGHAVAVGDFDNDGYPDLFIGAGGRMPSSTTGGTARSRTWPRAPG